MKGGFEGNPPSSRKESYFLSKKIMSIIRTWCDLKLWHLQFNIVNRDTLLAAQKDPNSYRNLIVRVAGYSAYFCDMSPDLQNDIIARTGHDQM